MTETLVCFLFFFGGAVLGGTVVWLIWLSRTKLIEQSIRSQSELERVALQERLASQEAGFQEKLLLLRQAQDQLTQAFRAISAESLQQSNQSFLQLAQQSLEKFHQGAKLDLESKQKAIDELVKPLKESLAKVDGKIGELEKVRAEAYGGLSEHLRSLSLAQGQLQAETANLVKALRRPTVRGRWGEMQLRRALELAGMEQHCDFIEQESADVEEGRLRPDLIVKLPNNRNIIVDAKVPLEAYLDALEAESDELRKQKLGDHVRQLRAHILRLGSKAYWQAFAPTPEFSVLFLPGEAFFSAALQEDSTLIEFGAEQGVILTTPTTLIALLKAVAYGWREQRWTENAQEISELGKTLHDRICTVAGYFVDLRKALEKAVESYNKTVVSMESRVLKTARKLNELGASGQEELEPLLQIDRAPQVWEPAPLNSDSEVDSAERNVIID